MASKAIMVVIVVVVLGGCIFVPMQHQPDSDGISITDSSGKEVIISSNVEKVCVINSSVAKFMKILGLDDRISAADEFIVDHTFPENKSIINVGKEKTPNGELIVQSGAKLILAQDYSNKSPSLELEKALKENYGIEILRLNCFGETMLRDAEQLVKLFGDVNASLAFQEYKLVYNNTMDALFNNPTNSKSFLFFFSGAKKFYNCSSEMVKIPTSLGGIDVSSELESSPVSSTSELQPEVIIDYDQQHGIDIILIRGSSDFDSNECFKRLKEYGGELKLKNISPIVSGNVYVIHTDILSGPCDYIGYVCVAKCLGIETELDPMELMHNYSTKYGFDELTSLIVKLEV